MRPIVLTISLALDVFLNLMLRFVILRSIVQDLEGSVINNNDGNNIIIIIMIIIIIIMMMMMVMMMMIITIYSFLVALIFT